MTRFEVEAMLWREKEKAFISSICLDLKPPYAVEIVAKSYPVGYVTPQFHKFEDRRGNKRKHVVRFLESMGAYDHDDDLCMKNFMTSRSERKSISSMRRVCHLIYDLWFMPLIYCIFFLKNLPFYDIYDDLCMKNSMTSGLWRLSDLCGGCKPHKRLSPKDI